MDDVKKDALPEKVLDNLYEYTKSENVGGFIICFVNRNENITIHHRTSSHLVHLALSKALEDYLENQSIIDGMTEE